MNSMKRSLDRLAYLVKAFVSRHHTSIMVTELTSSFLVLSFEIVEKWAETTSIFPFIIKAFLLLLISFALCAQLYVFLRSTDESSIEKLPTGISRPELVKAIRTKFTHDAVRIATSRDNIGDAIDIFDQLVKSASFPISSLKYSSSITVSNSFYFWFGRQPLSVALLYRQPGTSIGYVYGIRSDAVPIGISVIVPVSREAKDDYLSGKLTGFQFGAAHLVQPASAKYAVIVVLATNSHSNDPFFGARSAIEHLRRYGLLRKGVELLAPAADPRRKRWLEELGFLPCGSTAAGRTVYSVTIGDDLVD